MVVCAHVNLRCHCCILFTSIFCSVHLRQSCRTPISDTNVCVSDLSWSCRISSLALFLIHETVLFAYVSKEEAFPRDPRTVLGEAVQNRGSSTEQATIQCFTRGGLMHRGVSISSGILSSIDTIGLRLQAVQKSRSYRSFEYGLYYKPQTAAIEAGIRDQDCEQFL